MPKYYIVHEVTLDVAIDEIEDMTVEEMESAKTVGIFRAPTIFCHCTITKRDTGYTRGQKYGWWVHAKCGKPSRPWAMNPGAVISAVDYHLKEKRARKEQEIASQEPLDSH